MSYTRTEREFLQRHQAGPDMRVIDRAIKLLEHSNRGLNYGCCTYLLRGLLHTSSADLESVSFSTCLRVRNMYSHQLLQVVRHQNGGATPEWWGSDDCYHAERLAAIKSLREACLEAAKA